MKNLYAVLVKIIAFLAVVASLFLFFNINTSEAPNKVEPYIELINLTLISAILVIGLTLFTRMGGLLKKSIVFLNFVLVLFWFKEFLSVIDGFNILHIPGTVIEFFELFMIITLLFALDRLRQLL